MRSHQGFRACVRAETCLALGSCLGIGGLGQVLVFSRVVLPDAKGKL